MRVVFRKEAEADLRSIIDYFEGVAPEAVGNIMSDIYRSINLLSRFPRSGALVPERHFRRIVTIKYHFKLVYEVSEEQIVVLGIFRHQDREV